MDESGLPRVYLYNMDPSADAVATNVAYNAGQIVLSFFTSMIGCVTTLELLKRRTSTQGAYNWYVLRCRISCR
jgi:hypothetical protein